MPRDYENGLRTKHRQIKLTQVFHLEYFFFLPNSTLFHDCHQHRRSCTVSKCTHLANWRFHLISEMLNFWTDLTVYSTMYKFVLFAKSHTFLMNWNGLDAGQRFEFQFFFFFLYFDSQTVWIRGEYIRLQMSFTHRKKTALASISIYSHVDRKGERVKNRRQLKRVLIGKFVIAEIPQNFALDLFNWNYVFIWAENKHLDMAARIFFVSEKRIEKN